MALPELQQAKKILERAAQLVLLVPEHASPDAVASLIAVYLTLVTQKETGVDAVSPSHVPSGLQFLPGTSQVLTAPASVTDVILDIAGPTAATALRQEPLTGGLRVHITFPADTAITKDQLETLVRPLPYDAAVVIGAADLEALGPLFTRHTDFFYNTPIINLDHRADNEHFGTVNLVDITAGSCAEVAYDLITHLTTAFDADLATALYAGIIAGTDSFQHPGTTPRSFQIAARLLEIGADREAVIQHLVKTKPLSLLKLTGRLYARLRYDTHLKLFWSILRPVDFQESGATAGDLPAALRELANNIADFNAAFLLVEEEPLFTMHLLLGKGLRQRRLEIQEQLSAQRVNSILSVRLAAVTLDEAEQEALDKVRGVLP